jgi:ankyrin repeat protein
MASLIGKSRITSKTYSGAFDASINKSPTGSGDAASKQNTNNANSGVSIQMSDKTAAAVSASDDSNDHEFYSKNLVKVCMEQDWECAKMILSSSSCVHQHVINVDLTDEARGRTPLHMACEAQQSEIVDLLVSLHDPNLEMTYNVCICSKLLVVVSNIFLQIYH